MSARAKIALMARVFLSHSSRDSRAAVAVKAWLIEHEPGLAEESIGVSVSQRQWMVVRTDS
jgi:hypothetical protein